MNRLLLWLAAISLLILACGKDSPVPSPPPGNGTGNNGGSDTSQNNNNSNQNTIQLPPAGVYVAGDSFDLSTNYKPYPVYWVNGKQVHLRNASAASVSGIAVSDSNVYSSCDGIYYGNNVTYWKDTNSINLADPTLTYPATNGIVLSGGDVYVVGNCYINGFEKFVPMYWKNKDKAIKMYTYSYNRGEGRAIAVSGSDIYIAGTTYDWIKGNGMQACYWKNGNASFLYPLSASSGGVAKSIFVSGNDMYAVGEAFPVGSGSQVGWALYWKNGVATELTAPGIIAQANSVTVAGSDVYIAGAVTGSDGVLHATYWKNGLPFTLDSRYSVATAIAVSEGNVYVAGNRSVDSAIYWKNGSPVILGRGRAYAIAVKK